MTPPKRRTRPSDPEHHGRTTERRSTLGHSLPRADADHFGPRPRAATRSGLSDGDVEPTSRTASRRPVARLRPTWHRWVGIVLLVLGGALLVVNDLMMLQPTLPRLLPGGHNELYLLAATLIGGYSTRFFGWFDRPV